MFDGFSEVWRDDTPLTPADILELDAYCRSLQIDLVPSIATLGHLYKVLRTKSYRHLSEIEEADGVPFSFYQRMCHHTLNTTDEASLSLVYGMIDEFLPLFTSHLFNINGDEPFDLGRGRGKTEQIKPAVTGCTSSGFGRFAGMWKRRVSSPCSLATSSWRSRKPCRSSPRTSSA